MGFKESYVFLSFVALLVGVAAAAMPPCGLPTNEVDRRSFPEDFVFGTASAAYQYEGAAFRDGKGKSNWDNYTHQHPERIAGGENADVTVDEYDLYEEDVDLMKNLNFNAYRFSISWSRVLPNGSLSGGVNKKGIHYYNKLINKLLHNGIQPYVTLFHWEVPQALEDAYKGFMSEKIVDDFHDFANICFKEFGDRVKTWITVNEPWSFATGGYAKGTFAPGRCSSWQVQYNCTLGGDSGTEPYNVTHNLILAHAAAVHLYRTTYQAHQNGVIGLTLITFWYVPFNNESQLDKSAANRALDFALGWFLHPVTYGDYPHTMRHLVNHRLPKFTKNQSHFIKGTYDFLGLNYYTANYAKDVLLETDAPQPSYYTDYHALLATDIDGKSIGPKVNDSSWLAVCPQGIKDLLVYTKTRYENPIIYITENGYLDFDSSNVTKLIHDECRIKFYHDHLFYLAEAMKAGVKVKGFFAWSLLDNFEWNEGYTFRFGLTYVDFNTKNLTRIPKDSAIWFKNFLKP